MGWFLLTATLRAGLDADQIVPVLVTDLDEAEAGQVLATLDPLAAMATPDTDALDALVKNLAQQGNDTMTAMLAKMHPQVDLAPPDFMPVDDPPNTRLDQNRSVTCPECGHAFQPSN